MVTRKYLPVIGIIAMAAAVVICILAIAYSEKLDETLGGTGVRMEYESKLFNTDEVISINIKMDEDEWNKMLSNASSEEYYVCDVVINGSTFKSVAIRPKGNTSLSAIAMDPDSDRFSLKLEFDHFVKGQTCFGLDKLILNNNYADATNMKEALIYDMYQYIGAEASLYNYAKVSLNGEYFGVYLALEGVEQSFMLRNFGTQDGELYKPDSMEMGGEKSSTSSNTGSSKPDNMTPPSGFGERPDNGKGDIKKSDAQQSSDENKSSDDIKKSDDKQSSESNGKRDPGSSDRKRPEMGDFDPNNMPDIENFDPNNMPDMEIFDPGSMPPQGDFSQNSMPDMNNFDPGNMPAQGDFAPNSMPNMNESAATEEASTEEAQPDFDMSKIPDMGGGGFSMGGNGANLNYVDDELDSYSTIWDGEITGTSKSDHRRVITALKNISEDTDLEKYLDIDNILKYMAVHTFSVNMDSLSGSMAHNYYLYEYEGQLNMFPWDYNLSFGGMSMGNSADATEMVNDAIDTPFSGTEFFDALLENEEYLERYHMYLQQLVDEYVNGGRFDEVYSRIRNQIDSLVEDDPTAFYNYDEYQNAVQIFYETVKLRAESIDGQLNGTIPSTDSGQRADSSSLIDASHIDVKAMGEFNMGGGSGGGFGGFGGKSDSKSDDASDEASGSDRKSGRGRDNMLGQGDFDMSNFDPSSMPNMGDFDMSNFDPSSMPEGFSGDFSQFGAANGAAKIKTLITYGICLILMIIALVVFKLMKKRKVYKLS